MNHSRIIKAVGAIFTLTTGALSLNAGVEQTFDKSVIESSPFDRGGKESQLGAGVFFGRTPGTATRPDLDFAAVSLRHGWMLTSPAGSGILRGNFEFLLELTGAGIYEGPGSFIVGLDLLLRYNFIPESETIIPYFQIGAGGAFSDASDEPEQRLIGSDAVFSLQASIGVRFMLSRDFAIFIDAGCRHLSNANLASRNNGLTSIGGFVGVSWFY